jgi:hypothetical protein
VASNLPSAAQPTLRLLAWCSRGWGRTAPVGVAELTDERIRFIPSTEPSHAFDFALHELTKVRFPRLAMGTTIKLYTSRMRVTLCFGCVGLMGEEPPKDKERLKAEGVEAVADLVDSAVAHTGIETPFGAVVKAGRNFQEAGRARILTAPWRARLAASLASQRPPQN